jgi:hypothetical protein
MTTFATFRASYLFLMLLLSLSLSLPLSLSLGLASSGLLYPFDVQIRPAANSHPTLYAL